MKKALQPVSSRAQEPHRDAHRVYTVAQILAKLQLARSTFFTLKAAGRLPFLEEVTPRIGRRARYRADLIDRYVSGDWNRPRAFRKAS